MKKLLLILMSFVLWACNPKNKGIDRADYDLYQESQFANGFALIKDNYGKLLDPKHNEYEYSTGILNAAVMFGEMDLQNIKKQVIARMNNASALADDEGIWRPLYDAVRNSHGHEYVMLDAWVYWMIFNPQVDSRKVNNQRPDLLTDVAILTAMSRVIVPYWHSKIMSCMRKNLSSDEIYTASLKWTEVGAECQRKYVKIVEDMATEIYPKLKSMPQYDIKN